MAESCLGGLEVDTLEDESGGVGSDEISNTVCEIDSVAAELVPPRIFGGRAAAVRARL